MFRRAVDLSLTVKAINEQPVAPPAFAHNEMTVSESAREIMQEYCQITPFHFSGDNEEILADIILAHTTPHTHGETLVHEWFWWKGRLRQKGVVMDISQVPITQLIGEGSVVDVSDLPWNKKIDLALFKERAKHVQPGDLVIIRNGGSDYYEKYANQEKIGTAPNLTREISEWLVSEKQVTCFIQDIPVGAAQLDWWEVEEPFYEAGVLMIDCAGRTKNLKNERFYLNSGLVANWKDGDDSPARVVAATGEGSLSERSLIDLWEPIRHTFPRDVKPPYERQEPSELASEIYKRLFIHNFNFNMKPYGLDRLGVVQFKQFCNKLGTHIEIPATSYDSQWNLATLPANRICGQAVLVSLPEIGCCQNIDVRHLEAHAKHLQAGDVAVIRTSFTDNYYHKNDFLQYTPGFTTGAIRWLIDKGVKMIITDTASVEEDAWRAFGTREGRKLCFEKGIPIVNCITNSWMIRKERFYVFCSPLPLEGISAGPCRVIGVEEW